MVVILPIKKTVTTHLATHNDAQGSGNLVITGIQQITSAIVNGGIPIREGIAAILNFAEGTLHLFGTYTLAKF